MEVFAESGLARARVEDIAARAGVSKGTVYLYFTSKEDLFREAIRDRVARTVDTLSAAAPPGEPVARLTHFIEAYWRQLRGPMFGDMYRLIFAELPQFPEFMQFYGEEISGKVLDFVAEIVGDGTARGDFRAIEPSVGARMVIGLIVQHAIWTSRPALFPRVGNRTDEQLGGEIVEFVLAALVPPERSLPAHS